MNLWAISIIRKKHGKKILKAKVVDADTMKMKWFNHQTLYDMISFGTVFNNLGIDGDNVVLINNIDSIDKKLKKAFALVPDENYMQESFAVVLRGYKGIYQFLADNPYHDGGYFLVDGTVDDFENYLDREDINWTNYALYNGYVSKDKWGTKKDRNKIYVYNGSGYEEFVTNNPTKQMILRDKIECKWCDVEINDKGLIGIDYIRFNKENTFLPEGIEYFIRGLGGTYCVVFPKTLKKIYKGAFLDSKDILQVTMQNELDEIPAGFAAKSPLQIFDYPSEFNLNKIGKRAFYLCEDLKSALISKVKVIDEQAFSSSAIEKVVIPLCKSIGRHAFEDCDKLKTVKLGDIPIVINNGAFDGCDKLTQINLDNAVAIGAHAFDGCANLQCVKLPNVEIIGPKAFRGCKKIKEITVNKNAKISQDAFEQDVIIYLE